MKNIFCSVLCFALLGSGAARAAEFLVLDVNASPDVATMTVTDSSTIAAGDTGHKLATLLYIHEGGEWAERKMELDCTLPRWRELGGARHHLDGSSAAEPADSDWNDFQNGLVGSDMRDMVCAWPDKKPSADKIVTAELNDIIARASVLMRKLAAQSQRDRDNDK